ncbi:hypothetical protein [Actinomadura sp. NEAU-AAG7]|uniref:hypothetical protein n=1 Tax=Actinomadura sp. NEAU-AAG7 TaxID=2839640 RepID=UPI001BE3D3EF|nr:hypothetical protein [Actinomadura sp. NEAU-AAG7]MBT2210798.1 hypothetical protein [Actinomadura sp. NEAU-AAG7]
MSRDLVVLGRVEPGDAAFGAALEAAGEGLLASGAGGVLRLWDEADGRLVFSVEPPVLVETEGEPARVLGPEVAHVTPPVWWVEVRAVEDVDGAEVRATRFAAELSLQVDGCLWCDDPGYAERAGLRGR